MDFNRLTKYPFRTFRTSKRIQAASNPPAYTTVNSSQYYEISQVHGIYESGNRMVRRHC